MKKLYILSVMILVLSVGLCTAIDINTDSSFNVGSTYGDGSITYDETENVFYSLGGEFPTGYLYKFNESFSLLDSYITPLSYNYLTVNNDNIFVIDYQNTQYDYLRKLEKNGTLVDSIQVIGLHDVYTDDIVSLTTDENYIYLLNQILELYVYDFNLNYVGKIDVCANVGDCPTYSGSNLYSSISYDPVNKLFYLYNSQSEGLYIMDENFNDITNDEYYITTLVDAWRDFDFYDNSLIGGEWRHTVGYIYLTPEPPAKPNYHTILNPEDGVTYNYSKQYCVNENTYCNDSKYILNFDSVPQFYCDLEDSVFCSNGCNTLYNENTKTFYGECTQLACVNECQIDGFQECTTLNTYAICGNYDSDACLEYSNDLFCPSNQNCVDTSIGSQCTSVTPEYGDTYTQDSLIVKTDFDKAYSGVNEVSPFSESVENVLDSAINRETVTNNYLETQIFKGIKSLFFKSDKTPDLQIKVVSDVLKTADFTPQEYSSFVCQFEENYFIEDTFVHNNLNGNNWSSSYNIELDNGIYYVDVNNSEVLTRSLQESTSNLVFETIVKPIDTGLSNITYESNEGILQNLVIEYNKTAKTLIIRESTYNKVLVNDTGLQAFDDLEYIYIEATFNDDINTVYYTVQINRKPQVNIVTSYHYSLPFPYASSFTQQPTEVTYSSDDTVRLYQLGVKTISDLPPYTHTTEAQDFIQQCDYNALGCYELRTYGNYESIPTYHFYDEYQVCINELGEIIVGEPTEDKEDLDFLENIIGKTLSGIEKIGVAVFVTIAIFFFGLSYRDPTEHNEGIVFTITGVMCAVSLIGFSLVGYLPIWITGLCIIIGAVSIKSMIQKSISA